MKQAYIEAGVKFTKALQKRNIEEQKKAVLEFIKSNPTCTVTEIITIVGVLPAKRFGSIKNAFENTKEKYPRRGLSSVANSEIRKGAYKFEEEILKLLAVRGKVTRYYHIGNMIIDALFERDGKRYVIEIKDYRKKPKLCMKLNNFKDILRLLSIAVMVL